jgi:pyroglutamyl-peptidase
VTRITLLTSFDTWATHQKSNASDDLLAEILHRDLLPKNLHFLRKLPVDFQLAPEQVIARVNYLQPEVIICCGMAETRKTLTIESNAKDEDRVIMTPIDVRQLIVGLSVTEISDDAGQFVCNRLYYSTLKYIHEMKLKSQCLFVHVPVLSKENLAPIVTDFSLIIQRLAQNHIILPL